MFGKKKKVVVEEVGMDEFFENATPKEEKKEEKSEKKNGLLGKVAGIGLLTLGIGGALIKTFGQKDDSDEDEDDSDDSTDDDEDSDDSEDNED